MQATAERLRFFRTPSSAMPAGPVHDLPLLNTTSSTPEYTRAILIHCRVPPFG